MQFVVRVKGQREHAPCEPVGRACELVGIPVELLGPKVGLRIPLTPQPGSALAPELEPALFAGELVQGAGGEHRAGAAPHHFAPLVLLIVADEHLEPVGVFR